MADQPRTLAGARRQELLRPESPAGSGLASIAGDLALSPLRGLEDFGRDLVGLADVIPGVDIDTSGPRFVDRLFRDEEETGVGRLATGIFNFLAGFVPGVGVVGKFGKVGRVANLTFKAERAAKIAGKVRTATAINLGRGAAAGALADFTAFDGNEERLSNLLTEFPALNNVVTRFLAADEEDSELVGRGKQVLEGLGAGFLADALFVGLRGLRAQRRVRERLEATPGEAAKAVDDAVPAREARETTDRAKGILRRELEDPERPPAGAREATVETPDGGRRRVQRPEEPRPRRQEPRAEPEAAEAPPREEAARAPETPSRGATPAEDREVLNTLVKTSAGRRRILKERLQLSDEEMTRALADFQVRQGGPLGTSESLLINPRHYTTDQLIMLGVDPRGLNLSAAVADEGVGFLARSFEAVFGPLPSDARVAVPNEETFRRSMEELSDIVSASDPADLMPVMIERALERSEILQVATRMGVGLRTMFVTYGEEILERLVQEGEGAAQVVRFQDDLKNLALLGKYVREGSSEAGRLLQAEKIAAQRLQDVDSIAQALKNAGGEEQARRMIDIVRLGMADGGGVEGAAHMVRMASLSLGGRVLAATNEFWINTILSGAKTFATNLLSPLLHTVYIPTENLVGGALARQPAVTERAFSQIVDMGSGFQESMRFARKAWRSGAQILDPRRGVRDDPFARGLSAIDPRMLGVNPDSAAGHGLTFFARVMNLPTRLLMASDEFVKQMNYRTVAKSRLRQDGLERGLSGPALADHVTSGMTKITEDGQAFTIQTFRARAERRARAAGHRDSLAIEQFVAEEMTRFDPKLSRIAEESLRRANEAAFTTELPAGSLAKGYQNLRNQHPQLILMTPFVRTPINLARAALQRFPNPFGITEAYLRRATPPGAPELARLKTRFAKEVLSGDPERVAQAVGRQAFGISGAVFFMGLAAQGRITGRGPADKEQREVLQSAGWQPYSVRVGDRWLSYLRLDPWATGIGTVADVYDYARMSPSDEQENLGTLFMGVATALANNFTNKTYLQGISDVVDGLSDPERKLAGVLGRYGSAIVPNALAQAVEVAGDDVMRDVYTFSERVRSRIPGMSDEVPALRNLFGEPMHRPRGFALGLEEIPGPIGDVLSMISPITYRDVSDDEVSAEMVRLKHGFSPPSARRFQVDLLGVRSARGQSAWDRWLQLHGQVRVSGRTLPVELRRLIRSREYRSLSPVSTSTATSPRVAALSNVISEYRDEAWEAMLREFPSLQREITIASRRRRAFTERRRGGTFDLGGVVPTIGNIGGR